MALSFAHATKRITVSDLETRLMTQTARSSDFERALNERQSELSDERLRLAAATAVFMDNPSGGAVGATTQFYCAGS